MMYFKQWNRKNNYSHGSSDSLLGYRYERVSETWFSGEDNENDNLCLEYSFRNKDNF